jgi:hypothetical protein
MSGVARVCGERLPPPLSVRSGATDARVCSERLPPPLSLMSGAEARVCGEGLLPPLSLMSGETPSADALPGEQRRRAAMPRVEA